MIDRIGKVTLSPIRRMFEAALPLLRRNPRIARFVVDTIGRSPVIGPRLVRFAQARGYLKRQAPTPIPVIELDAAPEALAFWRAKLVDQAD